MSFATGLITNTIPCWLISAKNRSPSSENVICLTTRRSRDLVLANHSETRGQQSEEGYCVTFSCSVPVAPSVESVPVMVTVPAVPPSDPLVLPDGMLMMAKELEVNVVRLVTSLPFNDAANWTVPVLARLIGLDGVELMVREVDCPSVIVMVPETTIPLEDCAAACTVAVVPAGVTFVAVTTPAPFTVTKSGF